MNDAQKYLIDNKLNDRHLNDDASTYTSDAMISYAEGWPIMEIEKLREHYAMRGARMQILRELLYGQRLLDRNMDDEIDRWFDKDGVPTGI